ncbi:MAG: aspartate--tRNA ligase [Alphaproteobacteria bacterium]|nr:aspartate--tRNA ligase [Alphaproteobacteria bacterium]
MHAYRTHTCGALRASDAGQTARLSGWVHSKRDHGGLLFVDLRDHYGLTQCVFAAGSAAFTAIERVRPESVITVTGTVVNREGATVNPKLPTGEVELKADTVVVQSAADVLPMQVAGDEKFPDEIRLKYRFIDLRREKMQRNMKLRAGVIASIRRRMIDSGFTEFQTPILTASSPEGARDFLVPSLSHPGKFCALPQAPQQFKQLAMVAGLDRYFQIAPCFRDEASRADRSPGEFYQLDFEMSFVTQEDVFNTLEPVIAGVFEEFGDGRAVTKPPFPRIPYDTSMLLYGSDKPDLRNPLVITDVTEHFAGSGFGLFAKIAASGGIVRAIPAPGTAANPRSFFDKLNDWARAEGAGGLGYIQFDAEGPKGPIARNLEADRAEAIRVACGLKAGDSVFFAAGKKDEAPKFAGSVRARLGNELGLIKDGAFKFCWITDFPMFELNEETKQIDFSHNPFSMPQGELEALNTQDPLAADVEARFGGMLNAFRYGAPPHGGSAPGIDRIVMLLADEPNIREVILFPLNQQGEDLMMGAPAEVPAARLKELSIALALPPKIRKE